MARWQQYVVGCTLVVLLSLGGAVSVASSTRPGWLGPLMDTATPAPVGTPASVSPASVAVAVAIEPAQPVASQPAQVTVTFSRVDDPAEALPVPGVSLAASAASGSGFAMSAVAPPGGSSRFVLPVRFPTPGVWTLSISTPNAAGGPFAVTVVPPVGETTAAPETDAESPPPVCCASDLRADARWEPALGTATARSR